LPVAMIVRRRSTWSGPQQRLLNLGRFGNSTEA
jgi:hypothetical protein